jgi:hypothetical protein
LADEPESEIRFRDERVGGVHAQLVDEVVDRVADVLAELASDGGVPDTDGKAGAFNAQSGLEEVLADVTDEPLQPRRSCVRGVAGVQMGAANTLLVAVAQLQWPAGCESESLLQTSFLRHDCHVSPDDLRTQAPRARRATHGSPG